MTGLRFKKPMLAKEFQNHRDVVEYPCYVQPKLDGIRCITDGQRFWTRNGNEFPRINVAHLRVTRLPFLVDGELMICDGGDFEDLASIAKRAGHPNSEELELNVFDVITDGEFSQRLIKMEKLFRRLDIGEDRSGWRMVKTTLVRSFSDVQNMHSRHLLWGREGTMVRSASGLYVPRRTTDLLKYKPLKSAEFKIVGVKEGRGKDKGTPVYICQSKGGEFRARPMGTMKQRRAMWRNRENDLGKKLTVEFQNLTKYGKPRFPRAKVLRDYE